MRFTFTPRRFFIAAAFAGLGLGGISSGRAATTLTDLRLQGTGNQVENGAELTIASGGALTGATGSVVDLFYATVALPDSLSLKNLTLTGTGNQVQNGATLTLLSGATFTAASGSTINLSAGAVTFPSTVVLTTGTQTLTGKTLVSPVISSLAAATTTDLTLAGGSGGVTLTLGQGPLGSATFSGPVAASNLNISSAKVFSVSNSLTFSGTDSSTLDIGTGGTLRSGAYTNIGTNVSLYGAVGDGVNDDTAAITAAIQAAGEYGLVNFPRGDYAISTAIVPLLGQTLKFIDSAVLRMVPTDTFHDGLLVAIVHDDVTIDGARFEGSIYAAGHAAIGTSNAKRVTVTNCIGSTRLSRLVIFGAGSDYGKVINCTSPGTQNGFAASNHVEFNDSNYGLVHGCTFFSGGMNGVEIFQNSGRHIIGTRVTNNVFDGIKGCGVNMYGSVGAIVHGNTFKRTASHAVFITYGEADSAVLSQYNVLSSNLFENCGTDNSSGPTMPIYIVSPRNKIISNSIINTDTSIISGSYAILNVWGDENQISENTIAGHRSGIFINEGIKGATVTQNTIINVGVGSAIADGIGIVTNGNNGLFHQNTISDNQNSSTLERGLLSGASSNNNIFSGNITRNSHRNDLFLGNNNTPNGQLTSTVANGVAPFVVASSTLVQNLNAALLGGATFASPGPIGNVTPASGNFTTMTANSLVGEFLSAPSNNSLTLSGGDNGASLSLEKGNIGGLSFNTQGAGRITGSMTGNSWSINPGALTVTPNFVLGASGGKAIAVVAGTSGTGLVWDSTGFLDLGVDERSNIVGGSTLGGTSVARLTTNFLIGGTSDISGSGGIKIFGATASTSTSSGALQVVGGAGIGGNINVGGTASFGGSIALPGGASLSGANGDLLLSASGANRNITLTPSGTGLVSAAAPISAAGPITTSATTASTSTGTGALIVAGGFGLDGDQYLGGSLNFSGHGLLRSGGGLALTAGGTNQNITLTPSGSGSVTFAGPVSVAGNQTLSGSLTLSGGALITGTTGAIALMAAGTNQNVNITPSGTGSVAVSGPLSVAGSQTLAGALALSGGGTLSGSSGALTLAAAGTNQNITLTPSGNGTVALTGPVTATGALAVFATAPSISTSTGALVVAGGFGLAGNQFLGGSLNLDGGGSLAGATGSLTLAAGGTNQNISLTPSGSGIVVFAGPVSASGQITIDATTNSTSTSTGALVIGGGIAAKKRISLGDDLLLTPTSATAATVRLSGTALTDVPGIWFRDGGAPTAANAALSGSSAATILNGPSGGTVNLRIANTNFLTLATNAATLQGVPLNVTATTASISQTTGSATFGGGIGVNGRTSTKTLSVGNGAALDLILTVISVLDFPSVAANGGIQDLVVPLTGASLGDSVNIVEASGSFIPAGIVLRAIVTAPNTVTVRASNVTTTAIDPASAPYRITLMSF